jgi:amidase
MDIDVATATATELTQAIRDREISSRELLDDLIARAARVNPGLNAIVAWDTDRARAAALAADDATARGESAGPLHGLPMTVKDTFETEGLVTTSGGRRGRSGQAEGGGRDHLRQVQHAAVRGGHADL